MGIARRLYNFTERSLKTVFDSKYREINRIKSDTNKSPLTTSLLGSEIHYSDPYSFLTVYEEIFEKRNYEFKAGTNQPFIIDGGANIGLSTIFFKQLYPQAEIVAFEPDNGLFGMLEKNIQSFNLKEVTLQKKALWVEETTIKFNMNGGLSGRIAKLGDNSLVEVPTCRLRNMLNRRVDFLKLDVEGAETAIIKDCAESLGNVENLFIEYHSHKTEKQTLQVILSTLTEIGFRYHIKEAFVYEKPFINRFDTKSGMDLQLDIFAFRT